MRAARLETLAWVLIYAGLLALSLGVFVARQGDAVDTLATALGVAGGVAAIGGVLLIWLRSRLPDSRPPQRKHRETNP